MSHLRLLLIFLVLAGFAFTSLAQTDDNLNKAEKYFKLHEYESAITYFKQSAEGPSGSTEIKAKLAECYRLNNQLKKANEWYKKASSDSNLAPEYLFNYAQTLKSLGEYQKAQKWFEAYALKGDNAKGLHFAKTCSEAIARNSYSPIYETSHEKSVNSMGPDYGCSFFKKDILFSSARKADNNPDSELSWTGKPHNKLYTASINSDWQLSSAVVYGTELNQYTNRGPALFDGSTVIYTKNNFIAGNRFLKESGFKMDLFFATLEGDKWIDHQPFPHNSPAYSVGFPALTADGNTLYFASDMPGGYGGFDIYYSKKEGDSWSKPKNLGNIVNSPGNEITPYIDQNKIYFSSDYHSGLGGFDVFSTSYKNRTFTKPNHMGTGINTSYDEIGFIHSKAKKLAYFSSNRPGGKGDYDLYKAISVLEEIVLTVKDVDSNTPLKGACIDFSACQNKKYYTDASGQYSFIGLPSLDCKLEISLNGYESKTVSIKSKKSNGLRPISIALTRNSPPYSGTVVHSESGRALKGVYVTASPKGGGNTLSTFSDEQGIYNLLLEPEYNYTLTYSLSGFDKSTRNVFTADGKNRDILGPYKMIESTSSSDNDAFVNRLVADTAIVDSAYFIQIGCYSNPDTNLLYRLEKYGSLKETPNGRCTSYLLGTFTEANEANEACLEIIKNGYPDAFVLKAKTKLSDMAMVAINNPQKQIDPIQEPGLNPKGNPVKPTPETAVTPEKIVFMVQVGAFSNPDNFDKNLAQGVGTVKQKSNGNGLTLILIGDYDNYDKANKAKDEIISRLGKGPFVVGYLNGKKVANLGSYIK